MNSSIFDKFPRVGKSDKILLLTHNDLDGNTGALAKVIFDNVTVEHCSNAQMSYSILSAVMNRAEEYDWIIVTDISCSEKHAYVINKSPNNKKLILLDHHRTAEHLNKYNWAVVQGEMLEDSFRTSYYNGKTGLSSGTSLFYDFLEHQGLIDESLNIPLMKYYVFCVAAYDTWDWVNVFDSCPVFKDLNTISDAYGNEMFEERMAAKFRNKYMMWLFDETDSLIISIEAKKMEKYIDGIKYFYRNGTINIDGTEYSIVFNYANQYLNEVFNEMEKLYPDFDLYLLNYGSGISIRTRKDNIDVSAIMKRVGGGGHTQAAGCKISETVLNETVAKALNAEININAN